MPRPKIIPIEAINLAARTGFITKALFKEFILGNRPKSSVNRRWSELINSGFFNKHSDDRMADVYLLNKQKRELQDLLVQQPVSPPYTGIIRHDEIALRGILLIEDRGFLETWKVESEFKKTKQGAIQLESKSQNPKYPDAILNFKAPFKPIRVAIEIELTQKEKRRYERILNAYSFAQNLDLIIFVCGNKQIENAVITSASKFFYPSAGAEIGFMSKMDWLTDPVLADLRCQNTVCSLGTWIDGREKVQIQNAE
ncbi:MAG: hypothetical protein B7Y39_01330 [Bdellovibrio sp. 28-41-41]|nr:MAG: hypothetical protein B7Y39_01330 [Bdellovibrio sp. 28-41-41]